MIPLGMSAQTVKGTVSAVSANVDMSVLITEKSYELWFEGCRFQDLLRWSTADDTKNLKEVTDAFARLKQAGSHVPQLYDKVHRAPVYQDVYEDGTLKQKKDEDIVWENGTEANSRFYIAHTHKAKDKGVEVGFQEKHRLFPYPQSIKNINPNLKQKGWDY